MTEISVVINGRERAVPAAMTLRELLEHLELEPSMVVVERNREIVERDRYAEVEVEEGDALELVHFVGGG
ncbi:MAG: sulfur carrier protein ThiS [Gemmatimonadota bacterium]